MEMGIQSWFGGRNNDDYFYIMLQSFNKSDFSEKINNGLHEPFNIHLQESLYNVSLVA